MALPEERLPGPNPELMVLAAMADALLDVLPKRKREMFLDNIERVASEYDSLGNVTTLRGVSPVAMGVARRSAAAWLRVFVRLKRRRSSMLITG